MPLLNSLINHSFVSICVGNVQEPGLSSFIFMERAVAISMLDLASCIGASWIYQGHQGTLEAMKRMVRPGGLIIAHDSSGEASVT